MTGRGLSHVAGFITFLILCSASVALAEDFKAIDSESFRELTGKEYKNVTVSRVEPDGIVLISSSGISKVYFTELPKEVQERFHYDAEQAAAYSAEQTASQAAFQKQQEELQRKLAEEAQKNEQNRLRTAAAFVPQRGQPIEVISHGTQVDMAVTAQGPSVAAGILTPAALPSTAPTTIAAIALDYNQMQYLLTTETASAHFRYIVVQDYWHENVPALRAKYPDSKILVYKNVAATNSDCSADPYQSSGISYCYANAMHPEWFLHSTAAGHPRLTFCDYSYLSAMDIGNVDYQRRWAGAVIHAMRRSGFDGVMMDDTNLYPGHCMDGQILEYSDAEYRQATVAFIHAVGPAIMSAGYVATPNVGLATWDSAQTDAARDVALHVSVYNREFFVGWEEGSALFTGATWSNELALFDEIVGVGTPFNAVVYGSATDVTAQRYARATFLLGWDGLDGSALMYRPSADGIPYPAPWAADIGLPMAARYAVGAGWRRDFDRGTVVVDPSAAASQTFPLGGRYRDATGRCVTSVTLAPATALVMPRCP